MTGAVVSFVVLLVSMSWTAENQAPAEHRDCRALMPDVPILYLVAEPAVLREEYSSTSKVVGRMQPITTPSLLKWTDNWVQLGWRDHDSAPNGALRCGWLETKTTIKEDSNVLGSDLLWILSTNLTLDKKPWPIGIKADILRRRPRVGFTSEQVKLALGPPVSQFERETASGAVEVWNYPTRSLVFAAGKVLQIDTVK